MISEMCPTAHQRYLSLPVLGSVIEEFITWSHHKGYSPLTLKNQLRDAKRIDAFLGERGVRDSSDLTHGDFESAWDYYHHPYPNTAGTVRQIECFLEETHRLNPVPTPPRTTVELELDRFLDYLRNVRGLATNTVTTQHFP